MGFKIVESAANILTHQDLENTWSIPSRSFFPIPSTGKRDFCHLVNAHHT